MKNLVIKFNAGIAELIEGKLDQMYIDGLILSKCSYWDAESDRDVIECVFDVNDNYANEIAIWEMLDSDGESDQIMEKIWKAKFNHLRKECQVDIYSDDILLDDCEMDEMKAKAVKPSYYANSIQEAWNAAMAKFSADAIIIQHSEGQLRKMNANKDARLEVMERYLNQRLEVISAQIVDDQSGEIDMKMEAIREELQKALDCLLMRSKWAKKEYSRIMESCAAI